MKELHWALREIDPSRWRAEAVASVRAKLTEIQRRLAELRDRGGDDSLRAPLTALGTSLAGAPADDSTGASMRARWMAFRRSLVPAYEAMQRALRERRVDVPSLRPSNLKRGVFHVTSGLVALTVLWLMPHPAWTIAVGVPLALTAWSLEAIRRRYPGFNTTIMRFFAPLAHPHEYRRINSGTWYLTSIALLSIAAAFVGALPCGVGVAVLAFGDPAAAIVGRKLGRVRIAHGRSLEGTLAFFLAASIAGTLAALVFAPGIAIGSAIAIATAASVAGAVAELTSVRVDDNLSVAIAASAAALLACALV